jgi:hypothetical protein
LKGLAVAVAAGGLVKVKDHDLNEYRLAPKRYHRKIRSSKEGIELPFAGEQQPFVQQPDEHSTLHPGTTADEPVNSVAPNTSFLLELPYPSHFLVSLQMLNLSLPFIETGIAVPEDPPTPEFDLNQVLKNRQYQSPTRPEENQGEAPASLADQGDGSGGGRRAINRKRHRTPVRRLPKRSADVASANTIGKPVKFRSWNASNPSSVQRRQEFTSKLRSTTTPRPTFIKKFQAKQLNQRVNTTTKSNSHKRPPRPSPVNEYKTKDLPVTTSLLEQSFATPDQRESSNFNRPSVSGTSDRFVIHPADHPAQKIRMGGFRPIQPSKPSLSPNRLGPSASSDRFTRLNLREKSINGHSDQFIPIIPITRDTTTSATTETVEVRFDFPPPSRLRFISSSSTTSNPLPKPGRLTKYISQFHSSPSLKVPSEEITQIQKPETTANNEAGRDKVAPDSSSNEFLVFATTTTTPTTEFVPNLKFPSFELPSVDGSSSPTTLPPPLSIEELIKKFTGKDFVTDSTSDSSTPNPPQHPSPIEPKNTSSTTTTVKSTLSTPELESLDDLEASLKQLLVITTSTSTQIPSSSQSFIPIDAPTTSSPSTSTPSGSSSFTLPVLPPPSVSPVTEKTVFPQQETTTVQTTTTKETLFPSESEINKSAPHPSTVVNSSIQLETSTQPVSVQRGPLDVSSFDGPYNSGAGQNQGFNFQPSGYPQQQQQQFQSNNNFGGFSGGFGGGSSGDLIGGQQNPYYYGAGLFTGSSGGQGQFSNNFQNGFDGTLHYSPTGPPVGESNAITQGLSLLASFGGSGGGQQFNFQPSSSNYQQPSGYQQSFNDFAHPASLQASSQIQATSSLPSQGFSSYSQGYPSFNLVQQQPQSYAQQPYQLSQQPQNFPSQQQQQQVYAPTQQQSYQLVGANPGSGNLIPVQVIQFQPQGAYQSSAVSAPAPENSGSTQVTINPSQFGTLLSSSVDASSLPAGTASITSLSSSSTGTGSSSSGTNNVPAAKEKSIDSASSQLVEVHLKPVLHSIFADQEAESSQSVQLISVGPETDKFGPATDSLKTGARKSMYNRGLQSGYYP